MQVAVLGAGTILAAGGSRAQYNAVKVNYRRAGDSVIINMSFS